MKFAIVTGVSKGLGQAIASLLIEAKVNVLGISRSPNESLIQLAEKHGVTYKHFACDLGNTNEIEKTMEAMSQTIFEHELSTLFVVNNAAVLEPIDQAKNINGSDIAYHVHVNTIAPMMLINYFLNKASEKEVRLIGVTVTSGAADRPVYGWSLYCSTKASINRYTETVALEQKEQKTEHKIIAFNPGIMDTNMQEKIRASSEEQFADVSRFRGYKENNDLKDAKTVGGVLVDIITDEVNIENGKIYNVKDYF